MRRPLACSLALLLLVISASPALAARSGANLGNRGWVNITLTNIRGDDANCAVKVIGYRLANYQDIRLFPLPNYISYTQVGSTNATGGVTPNGNTVSRANFNMTNSLAVFGNGGPAPLLDVDGNEAVWTISNSCRP